MFFIIVGGKHFLECLGSFVGAESVWLNVDGMLIAPDGGWRSGGRLNWGFFSAGRRNGIEDGVQVLGSRG